MSQVAVPLGANSVTVKVLDENGADITAGCVITATSSDPTVIQIGSADPASPAVIPFTALTEGGTADLTIDASNSMGDVSQVDNLSVAVSTPTSIQLTYQSSLPNPSPKGKAPAPAKK